MLKCWYILLQRIDEAHDGSYARPKQLDRYLKALEQKLEAQIDQIAEVLDKKIDHIAAVLSKKAKGALHGSGCNGWHDEKVHARFEILDRKIQKIAYAAGISVTAKRDSKEEDRKRLIERLKEATKVEQNEQAVDEHIKEPWMEYIFGICKPDGRVGKAGSRFVHASPNLRKQPLNHGPHRLIHPQSRFMQGNI
jgi:hypothetical protein